MQTIAFKTTTKDYSVAVSRWTETLNDWYGLNTNTNEVTLAFNKLPTHLIDALRHKAYKNPKYPKWHYEYETALDTAERETLAERVSEGRTLKTISLNLNVLTSTETDSGTLAGIRQMLLSSLEGYAPANAQEAAWKASLLAM